MNATDQTQLQSWIRRRDADAFKDLTVRYSGLVYRTCLRITSDPGDAEDLTQECFETLASQSRAPQAPLGAWLHRVATNRSLNRLKSRRRRVAREAAYMTRRPKTAEIQWSDIDGLIDEAIAELPEDLRAVVVAHFLQSESYTSLAARLGMSRQAAAYRVGKGVRLIRKALKKRGVPVTAAGLAAMMTSGAASAEVPASVASTLGKLALSGLTRTTNISTAVENSAAVSTTAHTLGGIAAMKSSYVTAGAVVVLLAGGAIGTNRLHAQQEELQRVRNENRVLAARAAEAEAFETELQDTRAEMAKLKEDSSQSGALTAIPSTDSAHTTGFTGVKEASGSASPVDDDSDSAKLEFASLLNLNDLSFNGTVQESQILRTTADRYGTLFSMLKLPGAVQSQVRAALTAHVRAQIAAGMSVSDLYDGVTDTQQLRETLRTLLTPEEMAMWEAFESDVPYYHAQQEYVTEMTRFIPALSPENLAMASSVLADEKLITEDWIGETDDLSRVEKLTERYAALERARVRIGQTLTDPEQLALVNDYIQQQQAMTQAQIDQAEQGGSINFDLGNQMNFVTLSVESS